MACQAFNFEDLEYFRLFLQLGGRNLHMELPVKQNFKLISQARAHFMGEHQIFKKIWLKSNLSSPWAHFEGATSIL